MFGITTPGSQEILLVSDYIVLALSVIYFILLARIIWRVEKRLDTYFKLLMVAAIFLFIRQCAAIFVHLGILEYQGWIVIFELAPYFAMVVALMVMNSIVTKLDRER